MTVRLVAAAGVAVVVGAATLYLTRPHSGQPLPISGGTTEGTAGAADPIQAGEAQGILSPDAIRSIDDPRFMTAEKARFIPATAPVMGVGIAGEAHAYLLAQMSQHEIVNDRVGGRNVAVTW